MFKKYSTLIFLCLVLLSSILVHSWQRGRVLGDFYNASTAGLKLVFFDVGQGDSALIITPSGKKILVDGGPDNSVVNKLDQYLPLSDRQIDYIILTHPHSDHISGLPAVLRRYQIGEVIMTGVVHNTSDYAEFLQLIKDKNIKVRAIEKPQEIILDGVSLQFLAPTESFLQQRPENLNNSSLVFKLTYASASALFMGDYENEESLLASSTDYLLKSDLLKVGHHGSTNANDRSFLEAVNPAYAVISVGKDNSFGHPHYRTLYYLQQLGTEMLRTDQTSDILFIGDGQSFRLLTNH